MLRRTLVGLSVLLLVACGERAAVDDPALHSAITSGRAGAEVTFDGIVSAEPQMVGRHEHMFVSVPTGDRLEIDHNTGLAPWVPAHAGNGVVVHGQLYIDPGGAGIHCTHARTSTGCPQSGWIQFNGTYYE